MYSLRNITEKERIQRVIRKIKIGTFLLCDHCRTECREYYLVKEDVWQKTGFGYFGRLHKKCLEKRIDRSLIESDFYQKDYSDKLAELQLRQEIKESIDSNNIEAVMTMKIGCIETRGELFTFTA